VAEGERSMGHGQTPTKSLRYELVGISPCEYRNAGFERVGDRIAPEKTMVLQAVP
jgi:hypothetical protein